MTSVRYLPAVPEGVAAPPAEWPTDLPGMWKGKILTGEAGLGGAQAAGVPVADIPVYTAVVPGRGFIEYKYSSSSSSSSSSSYSSYTFSGGYCERALDRR